MWWPGKERSAAQDDGATGGMSAIILRAHYIAAAKVRWQFRDSKTAHNFMHGGKCDSGLGNWTKHPRFYEVRIGTELLREQLLITVADSKASWTRLAA